MYVNYIFKKERCIRLLGQKDEFEVLKDLSFFLHAILHGVYGRSDIHFKLG